LGKRKDAEITASLDVVKRAYLFSPTMIGMHALSLRFWSNGVE
jgi:hypothetical protein